MWGTYVVRQCTVFRILAGHWTNDTSFMRLLCVCYGSTLRLRCDPRSSCSALLCAVFMPEDKTEAGRDFPSTQLQLELTNTTNVLRANEAVNLDNPSWQIWHILILSILVMSFFYISFAVGESRSLKSVEKLFSL
jgi:hypothetical protein